MGSFIGAGLAFFLWLFTVMEATPIVLKSDADYSVKICEANGGLDRILPSHGNPLKVVCNNGATFNKQKGEK